MSKKEKASGWPQLPSSAMANYANPLADHPLMDNPLTSSLAGGFDFVKSLWGGLPAAVPGFIVPTVDLEELDKRITDLKAVESWLALNANMLRATIQALEVQRNTIATIKSIGGKWPGSAGDLLAGIGNANVAPSSAFANWPKPTPGATAAPPTPSPAPSAPVPAAAKVVPKAPGKRATKPDAGATAGSGQSAISWLGFLQDQFNQVAQAALAGAPDPKHSPADRVGTPSKTAPRPGGKAPKSARASRPSSKRSRAKASS
jgi:hypothetical protein